MAVPFPFKFGKEMAVPLEKLVAHCRKEWATVRAAPGVFILGVVIAGAIGYEFSVHEDAGHEQTLTDQLSTEKQARADEKAVLDQRIAGKDDLLTEYRSQLLIAKNQRPAVVAPPQQQQQLSRAVTRFSNANNRDLQTMAVKLASEIRALSQRANGSIGTTEGYRLAIREATNEYQDKYEADAIVLRDEILSRLPLLERPAYTNDLYIFPNNPYVLDQVATDLETLAKKLPL